MSYIDDKAMAQKLAERVAAAGGRAYYVGGYVRDALMHVENKDIDIEVHGISPHMLEEILDSLGTRLDIGKSFGIYSLKGFSVDIAMPRKEKLRGMGHRDFDVFVDPFIGTEGAAKRRDFTVNAMLCDVLTGEVIDHFGGREDLDKKTIRHVNDDSFAEDPLRVLRGAQFAARFEFDVAEETVSLCKDMSLEHLPCERIEAELRKALLTAHRPSLFFEILREMKQLDVWFPEVAALQGVQQSPKHHAEGDVWTHTMLVLDAAARFRDRTENPFGFMLAALAHDFGKAITTEVRDGEIHAYNHEIEGLPLVSSFIKRLTHESALLKYVLNLTALHMRPNVLASLKSSVKATNKLFDAALDPVALICLATADSLGQRTEYPYVSCERFLYERLEVYRDYMARPYVMGKDLIAAGLVPDTRFSELLAYAHKLRLAGVKKKEALAQTLAYARKL